MTRKVIYPLLTREQAVRTTASHSGERSSGKLGVSAAVSPLTEYSIIHCASGYSNVGLLSEEKVFLLSQGHKYLTSDRKISMMCLCNC